MLRQRGILGDSVGFFGNIFILLLQKTASCTQILAYGVLVLVLLLLSRLFAAPKAVNKLWPRVGATETSCTKKTPAEVEGATGRGAGGK